MKRTLGLVLSLIMVLGIFVSVPITANAASVSDLEFTLNSDGKSYSLTDCDEYVFSIIIPATYNSKSVTSIGQDAFRGCTSLASISIPDSVTSIGDDAFYGCTNLASITIPDSVTSIGDDAFFGCTSLASITIPDSVTSIGNGAFCYTNYYNNSSNWQNDVLYIGNHLISADSFIAGEYIIKDGTKTVADLAFSMCVDITSITIPNSVTSIGEWAFSASSLISVTIGNGVTSIGERAFMGCDSLNAVYITDVAKWCGISFDGYASSPLVCAKNLYLNGELITNLVIPDSVTTIGNYAFAHCVSLTSITIPDSVTSIGSSAFDDCGGLNITFYCGSKTQWNNIRIGDYNDPLYNNIVYNYDPTKPFTPKVSTTNEIGGVKVSWNKVADAIKYNVYRRQGGSKAWVNVGTTTSPTLFDMNVKSGIYYVYSVRAYNSKGEYSTYIPAFTSTRKFMETPKLTGISNATNGLYIKWNAVDGVTNGYRVYRRGAGSTYWTYLGTVKTTTFTDTSVKVRSGEYFRYTVIADGGYHSKFDTTGLYLKRLENPALLSATSSSAGITVKWSPIVATTGYYVYRKTANSSWVRIASVGGTNNTTFLDKTAKKGTTYIYTVRAVYGATTSSYNSGISCYDKF